MDNWVWLKNLGWSRSYEGMDDEDKVEPVSVINQNNHNYYYVVSDFESDDEAKENCFQEHANDKVEASPKTTVNMKVVHAMKKL